ncbi:MAG: hypothetical protein ACOCXS_01785 [Bacteroidota bacterium]
MNLSVPFFVRQTLLQVLLFFCMLQGVKAQFIDHFNKQALDQAWTTYTGDGYATSTFVQGPEHAAFHVDATHDSLNIWWAIIRRPVEKIDLNKLIKPENELRVEARIKVSHAPRRVNLHFNHQRTTDFHGNLKEFYIPDTSDWHVISMTTEAFDVQKGDNIYVQLAMMDWGLEKYEVLIDYIKVEVVKNEMVEKDLGLPLAYHPEIPKPGELNEHVPVIQDVTIDKRFTGYNFNGWQDAFSSSGDYINPVGHGQILIMRADLTSYKNKQANGLGLLEMHVYHLERSPDYIKDFGMVRLVEIIGGPCEWDQEHVTYYTFTANRDKEIIFNGQMIIDVDLTETNNKTVYFAIPEPVIQRLIDGQTRGLALFPLGAVHASFYDSESENIKVRPILHFNLKK